jgi:hypothetical protein
MSIINKLATLRDNKKWGELNILAKSEIAAIAMNEIIPEELLKQVASFYLGSIFSNFNFINKINQNDLDIVQNNLNEYVDYVNKYKNVGEFVSNLQKIASEIILLSTEDSHESNGKMAGRFRALARPDIAIDICSKELLEHPYSFVALTIRASAYADLQKINEAVIDIDRGLKLSYDEGRLIAATAAARIYQDRHEQTGDLDDSDLALELVQEVINKEKSSEKLEFIANIYMRIAVSRREEDLIDHANALLSRIKRKQLVPDKHIIEIAKNISNKTRPITESLVEMEENIKIEYSVDAVLIQNGFFYEGYMASAEFLSKHMGFATAKGLRGNLMTGVPAGGLENCIAKVELQGKKIAVVEQVGKSKNKMIREVRYVSGNTILCRNNLILEYKP